MFSKLEILIWIWLNPQISVEFSQPCTTHQKSGTFEQQHLVSVEYAGEVGQVGFYLSDVGYELVDDGGPRLVQGLIPDGGRKTSTVEGFGEGA